MSTIILLIVVLGIVIFFKLQGDNSKIPPASSPEGKKTRVIAGALLVAVIGALAFNAMTGGGLDKETNKRIMLQSIGVAIIVVLIPLLVKWKKSKNKK